MCGRYALTVAVPELARALGVETNLAFGPRYNIAPTQEVPVLRADAGARRMELMRWGLVPAWSKGPDGRYAMHNARIEGIGAKPAYRGPVRRQRCLVPADGWYEWQQSAGRKQPWFIARADGEPLLFAGVWDRWEHDGEQTLSCAILTGPARSAIAHIHPRMPLAVPAAGRDAWLDPGRRDVDEALALLDGQASPEQLVATPVSSHVNNARHDDPRCLEPIATA